MRTVLVVLLTLALCTLAAAQIQTQTLTPPPPTCPVGAPPYPVIVSIQSSNNFPNPGDSVTFTVKVTSYCAGTPTGTVDFYITEESYKLLGSADLVNGTATITKSLTPWTNKGVTEYVVANYRGDGTFQPGTSYPNAPEYFNGAICAGGGEIALFTFLGLALLWHGYRRFVVQA
jgi:hypothetical protein